MTRPSALLLLLLSSPLVSCGEPTRTQNQRAPIREVVAVTSAPAELIAAVGLEPANLERVGHAESGSWDANWSPSDAELASLVTARRVILMGAEFEPWAQRAGLAPSRTLHLSQGLDPSALISTATVNHTHGKGPAHSHGGLVPTTWTDPDLLRAMIHGTGELIAGVLAVADSPAASDAAVQRRLALEQQLLEYQAALLELKTALAGRRLFAAGHGLEYVARAVDAPLLVTLIDVGPTGSRSDHAASLLEAAAREPDHAGMLVWLGPIDAGFAQGALDDLGLTSVPFDLARGGAGKTVLSRLTASVRALASAAAPK